MQRSLILLACAAFLIGCVSPEPTQTQGLAVLSNSAEEDALQSNTEPLMVEAGDMVKVEYTGTYEEGDVFDSSDGKEPLQFLVGSGQLIPGFDQGVIGMALNEEKRLAIPPELGYGTLEDYPPTTEEVEISVLGIPEEELEVGMVIPHPLLPFDGRVAEIKDGNVSLEISHRFAGKTLIFDVKVVEILKQGVVNTAG